jgi:hypothetical protein
MMNLFNLDVALSNVISLLQNLFQSGLPVVFLPTHRSHLDYILLTFIMFHYDITAPHVAAGDNLIIPLFGCVFLFYLHLLALWTLWHKIVVYSFVSQLVYWDNKSYPETGCK